MQGGKIGNSKFQKQDQKSRLAFGGSEGALFLQSLDLSVGELKDHAPGRRLNPEALRDDARRDRHFCPIVGQASLHLVLVPASNAIFAFGVHLATDGHGPFERAFQG